MMKLKYLCALGLTFFIFSIALSEPSFAEIELEKNTEETFNKSAVSFELLGRGLGYSFNYDYSVTNSVALGLGLSSYSWGWLVDWRALVMPLYANYYFSEKMGNRFLLTGGLTFFFSTDGKDSAVLVRPVVGGGYEYRDSNGFLFRATGYLYILKNIPLPWVGLSFGFTF